MILRTARYDDQREEVDFGEISVFVADGFVITVRQGVASELHGARARLEQRPELLKSGSTAVLWAILDQVIDGYGPVVAELERDIEQVEETVFAGAVAPTERIYFLRREVTNFYRAVHPLLAVVGGVERGVTAKKLLPYVREVRDHLSLINEEVAAQRDLLATVLEANMAVISVEQTEVGVTAKRHHRTADDPGDDLPPADVRHRLLRPELRLAGRRYRRVPSLPFLRDRRAGPALRAAVLLAAPQCQTTSETGPRCCQERCAAPDSHVPPCKPFKWVPAAWHGADEPINNSTHGRPILGTLTPHDPRRRPFMRIRGRRSHRGAR